MVEVLDVAVDQCEYLTSGVTVLATRWQHRLSIDIDLFYANGNRSVYLSAVHDVMRIEEAENTIGELMLAPNGCTFERESVPISSLAMDT